MLITIDSLRADHVGSYGYHRPTTPVIDELAGSGVQFTRAISHGGGTPEAFPSILAAVEPPLYPNEYRRLMLSHVTLAEALKEIGYNTAAFHSNPFLSRYFHYEKGFDVFEDGMGLLTSLQAKRLAGDRSSLWEPLLTTARLLLGRPPIVRAHELAPQAARWARKQRGPFFLWIHFMDTHFPYIPRIQFLRSFRAGTTLPAVLAANNRVRGRSAFIDNTHRDLLLDLYDACIRQVDQAIGMLLEGLGPRGGSVITVILADHGEEFGEHGEYGHTLSLFEGLIRVPLIISGAGITPQKVDTQVGLMALAPTILRLLGTQNRVFQRLDLFEAEAPVVISVALDHVTDRRAISARTALWKYIRRERLRGDLIDERLYRLDLDAGERRNVLEGFPEIVNTLRAAVDDFVARRQAQLAVFEAKKVREAVRALRRRERLP